MCTPRLEGMLLVEEAHLGLAIRVRGSCQERFFTIFSNPNSTRIINESKIPNSNTIQIIIV